MQAVIQLINIGKGALDFTGFELPLHGLQMMMEIVLIAAHLTVNAPDLLQVFFRLFFLHGDQFQIRSFQHRIFLSFLQ